MTSVSVRLNVAYGGDLLFSDFELQLESRQITCLLGKSGSGKSTLLRFIAGLLDSDVADGEIISGDGQPLAGRIAWMAQQDSLLPWKNAIENVIIGSRLRGESLDGKFDQARRLLAKVELDDAEDLYPHQLSAGMRQRVSLARTLIEGKPINLLDEPFSALDASTRYQLQELTCQLLGDRTTLLVTHDPLEALRLADCIYVLHGRPANVLQRIKPSGAAPRQPDEERFGETYTQLMRQLSHPGQP